MENYKSGDQLSYDDLNRIIQYAKPQYPQDWRNQYANLFTEEITIDSAPPCAIVPAQSATKSEGGYGWKKNDTSEVYLILDPYKLDPNQALRRASFGFQPVWVLLGEDEADEWDMKMPYGPKAGSYGLHKGWGNWRTFGPINTLESGEKVVRACQPGLRSTRGLSAEIEFTNTAYDPNVSGYDWQPITRMLKTVKNNQIDFDRLTGTFQLHFDFSLYSPRTLANQYTQGVGWEFRLGIIDNVNPPQPPYVTNAQWTYYADMGVLPKSVGTNNPPPVQPYIWTLPRWQLPIWYDIPMPLVPFAEQPNPKAGLNHNSLYYSMQPYYYYQSGTFPPGAFTFKGTLTMFKVGDVWASNTGGQ